MTFRIYRYIRTELDMEYIHNENFMLCRYSALASVNSNYLPTSAQFQIHIGLESIWSTIFIFEHPSTCTININHVWENLHLNTRHEKRGEFTLYVLISRPYHREGDCIRNLSLCTLKLNSQLNTSAVKKSIFLEAFLYNIETSVPQFHSE
jgi:hypothetical protein